MHLCECKQSVNNKHFADFECIFPIIFTHIHVSVRFRMHIHCTEEEEIPKKKENFCLILSDFVAGRLQLIMFLIFDHAHVHIHELQKFKMQM